MMRSWVAVSLLFCGCKDKPPPAPTPSVSVSVAPVARSAEVDNAKKQLLEALETNPKDTAADFGSAPPAPPTSPAPSVKPSAAPSTSKAP